MLNELCQLADALEKAGISPKEWHPQLKRLPGVSDKKPCYCISIAEDGTIASLDTINEVTATVLRKWEPSNGSSFPGFNIQPLYRIVDDDQKKQIKVWREGKEKINIQLLKSWCTTVNHNWDKKIEEKLYKCLKETPGKLLKTIGSRNNNSISALSLLLNRVTRYPHVRDENEPLNNSYKQGFLQVLEKYLWTRIEKGEPSQTILPILVHEGIAKKRPEQDRGTVSVFVDIPDWQEFRVASREITGRLNDCLIDISSLENVSGSLDAFGLSSNGCDGKLPSVKLPIIADVKLRAMNSESFCQSRYGYIDALSFPAGQDSRKRVKGALEWLGEESREGETWGRSDLKELLFAYPATLPNPNMHLKLASCFGARKRDDVEARFANAARDVILGLQGITHELRNLELQVFALKKMDKARTKIVFHRNYSAQRLVDATQEWEQGCANIPDIRVRTWGDNKGEWGVSGPLTPFPLQISQCLNRVWKKDGTTECEVLGITRTQGIELLLDEQPKRFIPHLIAVALQNGKWLLLSLGHSQHRGEIVSAKGYDMHKLLMPSILGLLLYKLDIKKEDYMTKAPFLVGRMLKLADDLHALYCKEVRENKLPPQLIGNALMTAALDSPVQALAQLALRLKPYYGWAQTFRGSENGRLSGYFVGLYGDVAAQLSNIELPIRFNDAERAQLLLGYLAAQPKKSESKNETALSENK